MPTNSFTSASHHQRRQQILLPKELFPGDKDIKLVASNSFRRPVKLPLRKHHSFHFQPSQTVAGSTLKPDAYRQLSTKERYRNQGPLVFKPFSEKSAFVPITPASKSATSTRTKKPNSDDGDHKSDDQSDSFEMPRICGTSLKRHISNVETYTANSRKLHYADLEPLNVCDVMPKTPGATASSLNKSSSNANDKNNNSFASRRDNEAENAAAQSKQQQQLRQPKKSNAYTQYATLKFDEVNI